MSTDKQGYKLTLEVDLQCEKCCKKIQKVLCKLQSKESIRKVDYDKKNNRVTIGGPFDDPKKLSRTLRCKAFCVIKNITIDEEKKPLTEAKKPPDEKKPEPKKPEEKKQPEEKKPDDKKKPEEEKKPEDKEKSSVPPPPWNSTTAVNLQFTNTCGICYPWPCSDPTHCWGGVQPPPAQQPQWPACEGMVAAPAPGHGHGQHQHPPSPWGGKWSPSYCGGCGSCCGGMHGWPVAAPQPMWCPGPSACRGCNGCKIVRETKFSYEEYPQSACAVM